MSGNEFDGFGDIINQANGIFGATESNVAGQDGGLQAHDSARTQATPDGVAVEMQCRGCPRPLRLTVEYPELIALRYQISPHEVVAMFPDFGRQLREVTVWQYSPMHQAWWPNRQCSGCGNFVAPLFTPEEADGHIRKAKRMQWINEAGEQYLSQMAYGAMQRKQQAQQQGHQLPPQQVQGYNPYAR